MARKIQHKRGLEKNLPRLAAGEFALTTDTKKVFVGTDNGNIEVTNKEAVENVTAQLADTAKKNEVLLKTEGVGLDNAKPDLLAAIQNKEGETTFNLLSEPRPNSVNLGKLDPQTFDLRQAEKLTITNLISNGNFANAWNTSNSTHAASDNAGRFTATAAGGRIQTNFTTVTGNKYYIRASIKANTDQVGIAISGTASHGQNGSGKFEKVSGITTGVNSSSTTLRVVDGRSSNWDEVQVKDVMVVDLTVIYGAGNEPTKENFDKVIEETNSGKWFSGTFEKIKPFGEEEVVVFDGECFTTKPQIPNKIEDKAINIQKLSDEAITELALRAQKQVEQQYNKPTAGVEVMSYYHRRDRMPITALNYFSAKLPTDKIKSEIDGYPAYMAETTAGGNFVIDIPVSNPITADFSSLSFDYYANDLNLNTLNVDLVVNDTNYFTFNVVAIQAIKQGLNHLILSRSKRSAVGSPIITNVNKVRIRGTVKSAGAHTYKFGDVHMYSFKPTVTLWFDDQLKSVYTIAKPIMDRYAFKGVQAVIGERVGVSNAYQNHSELMQMYSEGWEHCNHTYKHEKFANVPPLNAKLSIQRGLDFCLAKGYGKPSYYLVNPGGSTNADSLPFEKEFSILRRVGAGTNYFPIVDMYHINSKEPLWTHTFENVKGWVEEAKTDGQWLVLLFHGIKPEAAGAETLFWGTEKFEQLVDYLGSETTAGKLRVLTASEALLLI